MTRMRDMVSYQDALTGHQTDQDQGQAGEGQYVTIQQAAQCCGVSSKTIQRAIQSGTLPARYPTKNRCEIAVSDLERIRPGHLSGHSSEPLAQRVAALEQRVQQLEQLVATVLNGPSVSKRQSKAKARERTDGLLPKHCVSLLAFACQHHVAEGTVQTHVEMGLLPVKRGAWTDTDSIEVTVALDTKGRAAFYQLYRGNVTHFAPCPQCPHGYQDSVSGHE